MDSVTQAAGTGISRLFDYGAAMIVLVLVGLAMAWTIRYLLNRCDERFDQSLTRAESVSSKMAEVLDRNTTTYAQTVILLSDVKVALQNLSK